MKVESGVAAVFEAGSLGQDTILTRRFGSFLGLFSYNLGVVATFCVVSVIYRTLGALLSLSWNAVLWAVTLRLLVRRALAEATLPALMQKPPNGYRTTGSAVAVGGDQSPLGGQLLNPGIFS